MAARRMLLVAAICGAMVTGALYALLAARGDGPIALASLLEEQASAVTSAATPQWATGTQVQNVDDKAGIVTIRYCPRDGGADRWGQPVELGPGQSTTYWLDPALEDGWVGSAEVLANVRVRVVTNITDRKGAGRASYSGVHADEWESSTGTVVNLPRAVWNYYGYSTTIYVQNAGTSDTNVTINCKASPELGGASYSYTDTSPLKPGYGRAYDVKDIVGPSVFMGSAIVSSSPVQPLAVIYGERNVDGSVLKCGEGFNTQVTATKAFAPQVKKYWYGYSTGIQVQNVGTSRTRLSVVYTATPDHPLYPSRTFQSRYKAGEYLEPGQSTSYWMDPDLPGTKDSKVGFIGSATITSVDSQPIVAIVGETFTSAPQKSADTKAVLAGAATSRIEVPRFVNYYYGFVSGMLVQNVGTAPTRIQVKYIATDGTPYYSQIGGGEPLAPGASRQYFKDPALPGVRYQKNGFIGSVEILALDNQPIVAVVNESHESYSTDIFSYNAPNVP